MIVITGANGHLGQIVIDRLLELTPASELGVSVRNPESAAALKDRGVRVRRGDFDDPASLVDAFEGASKVLIVSTDVIGPKRIQQHVAAIEAAATASVGRVYYTSSIDPTADAAFFPSIDHFQTEEALRGSGLAYTILRNAIYADFAPRFLGNAVESGILAGPADAPIAYASRRDLGFAAAAALLEDRQGNETVSLTGSEAVDLAGLAEIVSKATGKKIQRVVVGDEDYKAALVQHGVPEPVADVTLGIFVESRKGEWAKVDPALEALIGSKPTTVAEIGQGMQA